MTLNELKEKLIDYGIEKIAKQVFVGSLLVAIIFFFIGVTINVWQLYLTTGVFILVAIRLSFFRVDKVHVAVPDSFFLGRFLPEADEYNCRIPIGPAKLEGLRLRWFWHKYAQYSRDLQLYRINNQKYQTEEGSVFVRGIVRYRTTSLLTYRAAEMTREERAQALGDKVDNIIIPLLFDQALKEALGMKETLTQKIIDELNAYAKVTDPDNPAETVARKPLYGRIPTYSENAFASEIIEVNISSIEPPQAVQEARDRISIERLKNEELELYLQKDAMIEKVYKDVAPEKRLQALQVWANQAKRDIRTFELSDLEMVGQIIQNVWGK